MIRNFIGWIALTVLATGPAWSQTKESLSNEMSVVGVKLGMDERQVLTALPLDLRADARRIEAEFAGIPVLHIEAGSADCGWARIQSAGAPCLGFKAFLIRNEGESHFRVASMALDQYFQSPVHYDALEPRIVAAFGEPTTRILRQLGSAMPQTAGSSFETSRWPDGRAVEFPTYPKLPAWIWAPDITDIDPKDRVKLLDTGENPGAIGLRRPTMRVFFNVDGPAVFGLRTIFHDPVRMAKRDMELRRGFEDQARRRAEEAASGVRLR